MKKQEWNAGLDHLDPELVEEYVDQKDFLSKKKRRRDLWIRIGALAACLAVIVCALFAPQKPTTPGIEPYIPNGEPWAPIIDPSVRKITVTADMLDTVMAAHQTLDASTNQYSKVYSQSPQYLNILPLPSAEYLPIYSTKTIAPSESELREFINEYLDAATSLLGINQKNYKIETKNGYSGPNYYSADVKDGDKSVNFVANNNHLYFYSYNSISAPDGKRMKINGNFLSVLESDTNEQINEKLSSAIDYISSTLGKEYDTVKVSRRYLYDQLVTITICLYNLDKTTFPSNFADYASKSEYLELTFTTDLGKGSLYNWDGSKDEAFLTDIRFSKLVGDPSELCYVKSKARMLSLEEAEELLEKGYVFGGHSCPLCMAEQPEVDFSEYTCVNLEYVSGGGIIVPFYAFYKYIGETEDGIGTYAKTYVPAVEVSGLEEYFNLQTNKHSNN